MAGLPNNNPALAYLNDPLQSQYFNQGGSQGYLGLMAGMPGLEQQAFANSGLKSASDNTSFGMVDPAQFSSLYDVANHDTNQAAQEALRQQFGEAGYGARGTGAQSEMAGRLAATMAGKKATAQVGNLQQGATAQANRDLSIGGQRYGVYSPEKYYDAQLKFGAGYQGGLGQVANAGGGLQQHPGASTLGQSSTSTPWGQSSYASMSSNQSPQSTAWNSQQPAAPYDSASLLPTYLQGIANNQPKAGVDWNSA